MNWMGFIFIDFGGFQVFSFGVGFKKILVMDVFQFIEVDVIVVDVDCKVMVDDDGVIFCSFFNGDLYCFIFEVLMGIQYYFGVDIMFFFDELIIFMNICVYQEEVLECI